MKIWSMICNAVVTITLLRLIIKMWCVWKPTPARKPARTAETLLTNAVDIYEPVGPQIHYITPVRDTTETINLPIASITAETNPYVKPLLWGTLNGIPQIMFIDTGSCMHIVNERIAKQTGISVRPTTNRAKGFGGHTVPFVGCGEARVRLGGK